MRKLIAGAAIAATIVTGSVALTAVNPIGIAAAATSRVTAADPGAAAQNKRVPGGFRRRLVIGLADKLGMKPRDLVNELKAHKSIAQVATEHGVDPAQLKDEIVTKIDDAINKAVAKGRITQAKADEVTPTVPDRVDAALNKVRGK